MSNSETSDADAWRGAEQQAKNVAQAKALRLQAKEGGLRFRAYLPPTLAKWLLGLVDAGCALGQAVAKPHPQIASWIDIGHVENL